MAYKTVKERFTYWLGCLVGVVFGNEEEHQREPQQRVNPNAGKCQGSEPVVAVACHDNVRRRSPWVDVALAHIVSLL